MKTRILRVHSSKAQGTFSQAQDGGNSLDHWEVPDATGEEMAALKEAAECLRRSDVPVAFPTETVYGLGADATRSAAVKGIYAVKGRPSDNPLIVHVCDLTMLRGLLTAKGRPATLNGINGTNGANGVARDPIPAIYKPLISRFWPGPLTILLSNPQPSQLAPEVTAGLPSFGARMPASALARSLIRLAGAPLAAPSANASTRPSPTTAQHVLDDLAGRVELILDGGPCAVGMESTVVDGLCSPPVVLRPGGVSIGELRACPGWEGVQKAYRDKSENGAAAPRAPGMKYKHYSPRAKVVLYEASCVTGKKGVVESDVRAAARAHEGSDPAGRTVGVIRTEHWPAAGGLPCRQLERIPRERDRDEASLGGDDDAVYEIREGELEDTTGHGAAARVLDIDLGSDIRGIAQGLFSALREMDRLGANVIFVEGVSDRDDIAGAVMNRLRKAASEIRS